MNILSEDGLRTLISTIKAYVKEKIPTKTSQLTNDSNYITDANLTPYAKTVDVDTKLSTKADKNVSKYLTVAANGWVHDSDGLYSISLPMPPEYGLTSTDDIVIDIDISETENLTPEGVKRCQNEWAKIVQGYTRDDRIALWATSPPTMPLTVRVRKL